VVYSRFQRGHIPMYGNMSSVLLSVVFIDENHLIYPYKCKRFWFVGKIPEPLLKSNYANLISTFIFSTKFDDI